MIDQSLGKFCFVLLLCNLSDHQLCCLQLISPFVVDSLDGILASLASYNFSTKSLLLSRLGMSLEDRFYWCPGWESRGVATYTQKHICVHIWTKNMGRSDGRLIKSDEMGIFPYTFSLILIYFTKYPYPSQILFSLRLSQHKLKFWTGIQQKIRCGYGFIGPTTSITDISLIWWILDVMCKKCWWFVTN